LQLLRTFLLLITVVFGVSCGPVNFSYKALPSVPVSLVTALDSNMVRFIAPYKDSLKRFTAGMVGKTDTGYFPERPSSNLGNLCADLIFFFADSCLKAQTGFSLDAAVLNLGGLRTALPNGEITMGNMYEVMPFENSVVVLKLNGSDVDSLFKHIIRRGGEPISGLKLEVDEKMQYKAWLGQRRFDSRRDYWVATSDYLAFGGDGFAMFKNPMQILYLKKTVRDVLIGGVQSETLRFGVVQKRTERRIVYANEAGVPKK
jgi:2',3'-cyclic-nucleotide 2'-phosphodiesterase (5'-nucleotidase family)